MGKKKKGKKLKKERIEVLKSCGLDGLGKVKSKCCKKYKKAEHKRCKKCPCFDLLKKVA
ncbi:hypothetical protein [Winogradskyella alexanderae]|uniref:Uncharacterized protein n=1 Tax=Winogradskyella alexanderae TaxID=2877123 RepID=A0ABS7XPT9_9FLAO|nr:hypothetical protein [Winogradskyella alexanderae]MCA0131409.1 hypothetical protein [Winogradskyella alexanderae]